MLRHLFVVFALLTLALPAEAGRYVLKYEERGQVSVSIFTDRFGREKILFRALPLTADRTPGPAVLRLDGVYIAQWRNPAYEFEFDLKTAEIPSLEGALYIPWIKADRNQSVDLNRLTVGVHTVEVYFASKDGSGHLDRNRTAAPATQFRVEEIESPPAATTAKGEVLTPNQHDAAIKQSYERGVVVGKDSSVREREQLMAELKKASDELNELRRKVVERPRATLSSGQRYLPVAWKQRAWPVANEEMILVDSAGKILAKARIVEILVPLQRLWVTVTVPIDLDLKSCTVERQSRAKGEGRDET